MQQLLTVKYGCVYTVATLQQLLLDLNTLDELPNLYSFQLNQQLFSLLHSCKRLTPFGRFAGD